MKNRLQIIGFLLFVTCFNYASTPWGFYAHKKINHYAVFTLPEDIIGFYKKNINYLTEHAIDADKRRYILKEEASRHYIDIDYYGNNPFEVMPKKWSDATLKYTKDTIEAYGVLPWHIQTVYNNLVLAFKNKNTYLVLKNSADLGHYIADAHVPLHTTLNYNGQLTNQHGIHSFWESRLPELFAVEYDYLIGTAAYKYSVLDVAWEAIESSHNSLDSVLLLEKEIVSSFEKDKQYSYEKKGARTLKVRSLDFSSTYHKKLNGMVERRMRQSIITLGSLWYSAWIDAGQPTLNDMQKVNASDKEEKIDSKITIDAARGHQH